MPSWLCIAGCGATVTRDDTQLCPPCAESLGLPREPAKPVRTRIWTRAEKAEFAARNAATTAFVERIRALPEPVIEDPFEGLEGTFVHSGRHYGGDLRKTVRGDAW